MYWRSAFLTASTSGHGGLLRRTRETADRLGVPAAALTFDTHPDTLVSGHSVPLLNTPEDRAALMREYYGIDEVLTLHFDRETMTQPWERFAEETLLGRYHAVHLVCGHDFRFGDRGAGNPEKLAAFCAQRGIGFDRIDVIELDGAPVSSTRIRALLEAGDMAEAVRCLGHPHVLTGPVVSGRHLGRTIGIPTANLALPPQLLCPRHGVYAALACFDGRRLPAVVNIGSRPTVGGTHVTVEPWILDFDGDLYGRTLRLEFYTFLRPERKFDSLDELRAAILHNAEQTREFFPRSINHDRPPGLPAGGHFMVYWQRRGMPADRTRPVGERHAAPGAARTIGNNVPLKTARTDCVCSGAQRAPCAPENYRAPTPTARAL